MGESDPEAVRRRMQWLARHDGRYAFAAFAFVSEATNRTVAWIKDGSLVPPDADYEHEARVASEPSAAPARPGRGRRRPRRPAEGDFHVSGRELLMGFERLARERWGMLADVVLASWGVRRPEDVGEIVFLMVEDPELPWRKRPTDTREDFAGGPPFDRRFREWDDAEKDAEGSSPNSC